jgi:agmatine deiminase
MNKENYFPSAEQFRIPAEWEEHKSTWLGWPHNKEDWPGKFSPIPWVFGEMVRKISEGEIVNIVIESEKHRENAEHLLRSSGTDLNKIVFHNLKTNRGWLRDCGPAFIKNNHSHALVDFKFNAWAKYNNYRKDDKVPTYISEYTGNRMFKGMHNGRHVVLEGGAIDINGKGTLVTTEECLLHPEVQVRNPGFTKKDYEEVFHNYLGIKNVIWLGSGIEGDDTHGHVDDLCRFVDEKTMLLVTSDKPSQPRYKELNENRERLQDAVLEDGSKPDIIELPLPDSLIFEEQILPASYANFYISNSYVLVPTFNDPNDRKALNIISDLFKDRKTTGIHAVDLVWGLGTIHCLTHEEPA